MSTAPNASAGTPAPEKPSSGLARRYWWVIGLVIAAIVVIALAPAASSDPDGLDRVSEDEAFADKGEDPKYEFLPDYSIPGVDNEWATVVLSGLIGVGVVFALAVGFGFFLRQSRKAART